MFIAHGEKFRKNIKWILGLVGIAVSLGMVSLFTQTGGTSKQEAANLPTIGGKPVNSAEYQDARNAVVQLTIVNTGRELRRTPEIEDRITEEAVIWMLILRKADEWGVHVANSEVVEAIRNQPILINEAGQFDLDRYHRFTIYLNNLGISEARYEELLRHQILREHIEQLVSAAAVATPEEVNLTFTPLNERVSIAMAQFDVADYREPVAVSNEEARAVYEQNQEAYRLPAQVKVRYAHFTVEDFKKTVHLAADDIAEFYERNKIRYMGTNGVAPSLEMVKADVEKELLTLRAERAASDRATEFSVHLVPKPGASRPDFAATGAEFGVKPVETEYFTQSDHPIGATGSVAFVQQACALSPEAPTSDPVPGPDGFYVLEYLDGKPSVVPPFEDVKDKVIDQIKQMRVYNAVVSRAQETVAEIKKRVAAGRTFAEVCADLKLHVETPPAFTISEEKLKLPGAQRIQAETLHMPVGAVSEFIPTATGGVVFQLKDRQPPDPANAEREKARWTQRVLQQNRQALFHSWLNSIVREEQVNFPRRSRPVETELPETEAAPPS